MTSSHLAQANIARMRFAADDARMSEFVEALDRVNAEADSAPGFVWRLQTEAGHSLAIRAFADPRVLFNLSVWESLEELFHYTYRSGHGEYFRRRKAWFEPPDRASVVLWWIPRGVRPTIEEALDRFASLWEHGPSESAFDFRSAFGPDGSALDEGWRRHVGTGGSPGDAVRP